MDIVTARRETVELVELLRGLGARREIPLSTVNYPRGKIIFQPGDRGEAIYLIRSGHVRLYRLSPEGREVTLALLGPDELFGEQALIARAEQSAFAEVHGGAELDIIMRADFERALERHPELGYRMMVRMSRRLEQAENRIDDLVNRDVAARVARTLLELGESFGRRIGAEQVMIDLRLPYQEIANMVGSTRETVTRAISEMQQNNWVRLESGRLHLLDRGALELLGI